MAVLVCIPTDISAFNTLSGFVIAFLPRSKCLLISWLWSLSAVILEPKKIKMIIRLQNMFLIQRKKERVRKASGENRTWLLWLICWTIRLSDLVSSLGKTHTFLNTWITRHLKSDSVPHMPLIFLTTHLLKQSLEHYWTWVSPESPSLGHSSDSRLPLRADHLGAEGKPRRAQSLLCTPLSWDQVLRNDGGSSHTKADTWMAPCPGIKQQVPTFSGRGEAAGGLFSQKHFVGTFFFSVYPSANTIGHLLVSSNALGTIK